MTVKGELHHLVDELPEQKLTEVCRFIYELGSSDEDADDEPMDPEALASLERGLADIAAGRVISLEEFNRKHPI